jgi:hypothetical protein
MRPSSTGFTLNPSRLIFTLPFLPLDQPSTFLQPISPL